MEHRAVIRKGKSLSWALRSSCCPWDVLSHSGFAQGRVMEKSYKPGEWSFKNCPLGRSAAWTGRPVSLFNAIFWDGWEVAAWGVFSFFFKFLVNADPRSWQRNQWIWGIVLYFNSKTSVLSSNFDLMLCLQEEASATFSPGCRIWTLTVYRRNWLFKNTWPNSSLTFMANLKLTFKWSNLAQGFSLLHFLQTVMSTYSS